MIFIPTYQEAINRKNKFLNYGLSEYSKLRNYDYGPEKRENVSGLSPYITHGLIDIVGLAQECIDLFGEKRAEKYIAELFWGIYWKGYLELRPSIWTCFKNDLENLRDYQNEELYLKAINGETNISCFNDWVKELREYNYLHNHTRMWFASIWIFTLKLPWQLGAAFFMKHLYDGDAAANTLGWRWVAGIQTQGKNYLASEWNIKKFTNNRFGNIKLNENAPPKTTNKVYSALKLEFNNPQSLEEKDLIIFENNLSFETSEFNNKNFKKIFLVTNKNENRTIKLSEKVIKFKSELIEDQKKRLEKKSINCEIIDLSELQNLKEKLYCLYPTVGENLDYININKFKIDFLYRKLDQFAWKYCNKGFFNFKNYIPKIITTFN